MTAGGALVDMRRVAFAYAPDRPVLSDFSCQVRRGEHVAVTGESGAGKSTLLNLLGLLEGVQEGTYLLADEDVSVLSDRARADVRARTIGFVFQAFHLLPALTALQNVELGARYLPSQDRRASAGRASEALAAVGLEDKTTARPDELSGGQQQRVAIARALVRDPLLLLCDEPTGNLDDRTSASILSLLRQACGSERALVVVTHDPRIAQTLDREIVVEPMSSPH